MLICEMAAFYSRQGKNLVDVLNELYATYGYYLCTQQSFGFEGEAGMEIMKKLMNHLRENPADRIDGDKVIAFGDYLKNVRTDRLTGEQTHIDLPKSDVLMYEMEGGSKAVIRPSGTEPKIKVYYFILAKDEAAAREKEAHLQDSFTKLLKI